MIKTKNNLYNGVTSWYYLYNAAISWYAAFFAAISATSTHLFDTCDPMKVPRPLVALLLPKILIRLGCGVTIKTITILSSSFLLSKVTSGLSKCILLDASA